MILALISLGAAALGAVPDTIGDPQGIEYVIEARVDESQSTLTGRAQLRYTNNAPVPLDTLWFHEHLNAFRPESDWARRELEYGERRFQDLGPEEHAFERLQRVEVDGRRIMPVYPGAPDSTVVAIPLPTPLAPGATTTVMLDWTARPSTLPRRQGREGRRYDWAQWYPRIAAYTEEGWQVQPLMPQGEFFGEFATYDVTLDVAADQVIGSTGVPVEGDPGWDAAADVDAFYDVPRRAGIGLLRGNAGRGRKRVRWYAEDVHHFAWSMNPEFRYAGGSVPRSDGSGPIAIHVLSLPSDTDWGPAVERTRNALASLQETFGPYPWPQLTNIHRIESGGTEFPMVIMNGSAGDGLIMHETAHQYVHGIFANNEFREGWLDEGFSSYLTDTRFFREGNANVFDATVQGIMQVEARQLAEPIGLPGAEFSTPAVYSTMTYAKGELVLRMLEWLVGTDTMNEALRLYYQRHALSHVTEDDLRDAVEDASGMTLGWFFDQWIHTTGRLDYAIAEASVRPSGDGAWITRVRVRREGEAWMPVDLEVAGEVQRLNSGRPEFQVEVRTANRPTSATLDPEGVLIDYNRANNSATVTEMTAAIEADTRVLASREVAPAPALR